MATFKSEFQDLATELISDEFADFRVAFRVFKESDAYDPRTGESGDSETYDLQAIPLEIEDALRVFANATNDNIYLVALKAGSSQEFDTSYTAEYDSFLYSIERVVDDPADAAYFFSLVGGSKQKAPQPTTRLAPSFNGVSQYAEHSDKIVDVDNMDGFVLEGYFTTGDGTFFSQNTSSVRANREFHLYELSGFVYMVVRGAITTLLTSAENAGDSGVFRFEFTLNQCLIYLNGMLIKTANYTKGTAPLEVGARFIIGGMNFDDVNVTQLKSGVIRNVKVNNGSVYNFPMDDGWQNNPTMRNAGIGADGTFINMTEAAWQEIPL